ncbi:hypothetical protein NQ317_012353 [Molorchus minor]|uniref:Uncharacterized protein n=1 Tax=Molorchus minor TaxID=1323400 RepID=A0ABQ9J158_9CUCU|nr:hypothetical protein NQ317_012353 [Molorchus minor]
MKSESLVADLTSSGIEAQDINISHSITFCSIISSMLNKDFIDESSTRHVLQILAKLFCEGILINERHLLTSRAQLEDLVHFSINLLQENKRLHKKSWIHLYVLHPLQQNSKENSIRRRNSGINTNMAIESFDNLLKTIQLKRNARVTIDIEY